MSLALTLLVLATALFVDRVVGDPPALWKRIPHPIVLAGRAVDFLDRHLNDDRLAGPARRLRGVAATLVLVVAAGALGWALHRLVSALPFAVGLGSEAVIVSLLLAQKSLIEHVENVGRALVAGGVPEGRRAVAHIVGRDVASLDEAGVSRAAMESGAENFSDGIVAPAFWYALLGLPGLLIYKAVNTADSMIGHRTPRHADFGWSAARLDDLLNFAPARLSALLIAAAALVSGCDGRAAALAAWRDAPKHKSPNAGWPEAALAGALGVAFGGPRRYGADAVDGAWLNREGRADAGPDDILAAIRLIDVAWALMLLALALAAITLLAIAR